MLIRSVCVAKALCARVLNAHHTAFIKKKSAHLCHSVIPWLIIKSRVDCKHWKPQTRRAFARLFFVKKNDQFRISLDTEGIISTITSNFNK